MQLRCISFKSCDQKKFYIFVIVLAPRCEDFFLAAHYFNAADKCPVSISKTVLTYYKLPDFLGFQFRLILNLYTLSCCAIFYMSMTFCSYLPQHTVKSSSSSTTSDKPPKSPHQSSKKRQEQFIELQF